MAKRKSQPIAGGSRKRTIDLEDVRKGARTLKQQAAALDALAEVMKTGALGEIEIDGYGLLERGINEVDRFVDNVDKGVKKARRDKERSSM